MAENNATNLRQGTCKAFAEGVVSEKDLKFYAEDGKTIVTTDEMAASIKGSVSVKTDEFNFIRYNVNVAKKTKAGTDNKAYPGILTVMNEYQSIAEAGAENADKVRVSGDINLYQSIQSGEEIVNYKSNFFNRCKADAEFEPHAEFEVEMFIKGIIPEMSTDGEETGRLKVQGIVPVYNGVECVTLVAPEDIADSIDSTFEVGQTATFYGDLVNSRVEKVTEIPTAIGKPRKKVETTYKNELIITGATEPYEEGVSQFPPYDADVIKAAMQERANKFEERKAAAQSGNKPANQAKPSGKAHGGRTLGF